VSAVVSRYLKSYRDLLRHFNCRQEYFIKSMIGYNWEIITDGAMYFLEYWEGGGAKTKTSAVVVCQDGRPLVYNVKEYALVVAIDCVKVGFLMETRLGKTDLENLTRAMPATPR